MPANLLAGPEAPAKRDRSDPHHLKRTLTYHEKLHGVQGYRLASS